MADEHIATYLNDHLAGSVVAIELLEHLEQAHAGSVLGSIFAGLRADIEADRKQLESLMTQLNVSQSGTRKVTAWLTEKVTELKLHVDDPAGGALRLLEASEAVALGIEGKLSLWRALAEVAKEEPGFGVVDYERLIERAADQHNRIEEVRLEAAKRALRTTP